MSSLSDLPKPVLQLIMQFVPVMERLTICCLLSKELHAAAVAATQELELTPEQVQSAYKWMMLYGHNLKSLKVQDSTRSLLEPTAYGTSAIQSCPNLTKLVLQRDSTPFPTVGGASLARLAKLEHLDISSDSGEPFTLSHAVLPSLSALTYLHVDSLPVPGVLQLGDLARLQHLKITSDYNGANTLICGVLPRLSVLTHLHVNSLSVEGVLQLSTLTCLRELHLNVKGDMADGPTSTLGAAFPASLEVLTVSSAIQADFLSLVPAGLQTLRILEGAPVQGPAEGHALFLSSMSRLQRLTELELALKGFNWPPVGPAYTALTASSYLVSLEVCASNTGSTSVPSGGWPYVFHKTSHLPGLTSLNVYHIMHYGDPLPPSAWGAADISSLVSCCPNLHSANLTLQHGRHVSELQQLTALTSMAAVYGRDESSVYDESLKGLAVVTQLRFLNIALDTVVWPPPSMLFLTRLTALTTFKCSSQVADQLMELVLVDTEEDMQQVSS